jgi:hypothetical protein
MMKKRIVNLIALLLAAIGSQAQSFTHSLALPKTDSTGYYKIELPLELYAVCNNTQSDIRIYETGTKNETPYILRLGSDIDESFKAAEIPVPFEILKLQKDRHEIFIPSFNEADFSELRFRYSPQYTNMSEVIVKIYSALDNKTINAEERPIITNIYGLANETAFSLSLGNRPKNQACRIVFEGVSDDFYITGITRKNDYNQYSFLTKIDSLPWKVTNNTIQKSTLVKGSFPFTMPIIKMEIEIDSTGYYNRNGNLSLYTENGKSLFSRRHYKSFGLYFNQANLIVIDTDNDVANRFSITINNKDNKPLPIKTITAYAPKIYVLARFEAGKQYELMAGNAKLKAPQYDWDDSYTFKVAKNHSKVATAALQSLEPTGESKNGLLLWGAVGLCIVVMGGMALSMIKRTKV